MLFSQPGPNPQNQPASTGLSQIIKNPESFLFSKVVRGSVGSELTQTWAEILVLQLFKYICVCLKVCVHVKVRGQPWVYFLKIPFVMAKETPVSARHPSGYLIVIHL